LSLGVIKASSWMVDTPRLARAPSDPDKAVDQRFITRFQHASPCAC
jgi:hypothetical protein